MCERRRKIAWKTIIHTTVKQKVWNEAENRERDWGETLIFFLSPHTPYVRVRLALFARLRLSPRILPVFLTDLLRRKPAVLQSSKIFGLQGILQLAESERPKERN